MASRGKKMRMAQYFFISENIVRNPAGLVLLNESNLVLPGMVVFGLKDMRFRGIPKVTEIPSFKHIKKEGPYPRDIERYGSFWIVSKKLKDIFCAFDPDAFDFLECELNANGTSTIGEYWICDVIRVIDAIDEAKSELFVHYVGGEKHYNFLSSGKISLNEFAVKGHRVFMVDHCWPHVMCDEELVKICKSEKIKNIYFQKVENRSA